MVAPAHARTSTSTRSAHRHTSGARTSGTLVVATARAHAHTYPHRRTNSNAARGGRQHATTRQSIISITVAGGAEPGRTPNTTTRRPLPHGRPPTGLLGRSDGPNNGDPAGRPARARGGGCGSRLIVNWDASRRQGAVAIAPGQAAATAAACGGRRRAGRRLACRRRSAAPQRTGGRRGRPWVRLYTRHNRRCRGREERRMRGRGLCVHGCGSER